MKQLSASVLTASFALQNFKLMLYEASFALQNF
jgi:hypothetical protein